MEQTVDIPGGGLQDFRPGLGSSSSYFPAAVPEALDEPGQWFLGRQELPLPVLAAPSVAHGRLHFWTRASWWQQRSVCPGGGATLSSRMGPVTIGTLCGSSRQSRLAGSMTSGTPHSLCRQGLRCLSVVLVLGCIAVRVGVRIRPMGKDSCLSVVLVLECIAVRVCVRILPYGQRLSLSLRGFGARVHCPARWCTNTAYGQGLVSPWSWCSARVARIGARIRLMGKDFACFSVVLVLSGSCAHWCADTASWQGLRLFFRVLVLVCSVLDIFGVPVWCMRLAS